MRFRSWVESEYHRSPHRGLGGATPIDRWIERAKNIIGFDPTIDLERAFLHETSRKVYRDSTVTLDGKECGTARRVDSYANTKVHRSELHKDCASQPEGGAKHLNPAKPLQQLIRP